MRCAACQHENSVEARFCEECGARLRLRCPPCGFDAAPAAKFCAECGQQLGPPTPPLDVKATVASPQTYTPTYLAEKILLSKSALEGERKQVTVLFADLKGSMELLADRDPEEARQLLDPVLERMMAAVHRYEGTVNQVLGDGIMALFGAPLAHEDHAVRACYAALAMQAAMRRYTEEMRRTHGIEVQIRVGLNSGEVVVRAIGNDLHMDYSAIGQTTHLAARMEQLATPGSIRLTAATLRLVEGLAQVTSLGPFPVKGLAEPVEVFELVGASPVRRRLHAAAARGLTHFVGRQTELEALRQALAHAGAGHGQVLAVVGEPGGGKSRLVYECIHSHRTHGWLVLESASVSYGKATAYFPVIDLLKRYCTIADLDDPRTIRAKVTGQVVTLDATLQETIPALLSLLEALPEDSPFLQLDPPQRRQRTLDALKRVVLRESQIQSLLLVFEDLHWIDAETQALLDSLIESLPTARLLLLVNYRPEYQHGWGRKTYYTQLRLDPLPPESAEELLQALLGDDTSLAPLKRLLSERTEGNPFFLEESVWTLVETKVLVGERGAYRLDQPLQSMQVPATVQAVLAARIDRLPPEEKRLLQTAAVIGMEVPFVLIQAIASAQRALALATANGEVVLHALANHYLGTAYLAQGDYRRAIDCFRQIVAFLDGVRRRERFGEVFLPAVSSRARFAVCHAELGMFPEGTTLGEEGLQIAEAVDHPASLTVASWGIGLLFLRQGELPRALPRLERAVSICHEADLPAYFPEIAAALGAAYALAERVADAVPLLMQALAQATAMQRVDDMVLCCLSLGEAHLLAGRQAYALRLLGDIAARREPPEAAPAADHYRQALARAEILGMRLLQAHCHRGFGTLYARIGQREQAHAALSTAVELYRAMEMSLWLPQAEAALAQMA